MEAAKSWNYTLSEWEEESVFRKAKAMAHYLHMNMRANYEAEHNRLKSANAEGNKNERGMRSLMSQMGI